MLESGNKVKRQHLVAALNPDPTFYFDPALNRYGKDSTTVMRIRDPRSGIQCFSDPWILDPDPGWKGKQTEIREKHLSKKFFGLKTLNKLFFLCCGFRSGSV